MKVTMVNDCAFVGETILKYLPKDIDTEHIKRSRGLWSKTFGIAYNIWRAKADLYHVHYLLQDCYLTSVLGKRPLIGHAHGSDLASTIDHFALGRMVRSNLRKCDKILVSTPDLLEIAERHLRDAEYLPNPVDPEFFYRKPPLLREQKLKVLIASGADWVVKGTDMIIQALARLKDEVEVSLIQYGKDLKKTMTLAKSLGLELKPLPKVPHEKMNNYYWNSDVVMGQGRFNAGVLGLVSLEAIACGRPVLANISSKYPEYEKIPLKNLDSSKKIEDAIKRTDLNTLWKSEYAYFKENHDVNSVVAKILRVYEVFLKV